MSCIDRNVLGTIAGPVEQAQGLPNAFYTDPEIYVRERDILFARQWACIGFAHDVPEQGDVWPVDLMGQPLLMVRNKRGEVAVYHNVCRHRGMILVTEPGNSGAVIRCPYHSWTYGLDGGLRATPHVGGAGVAEHPCVTKPELGLVPVRSHVFMGLVFVNLSGDAPEFDIAHSVLRGRWAEFADQPLFHAGADSSFSLTVETNWKLAVENYCESYHLPWIHPSLNSYSRIEDHYNIVEPGLFSGQGTTVYQPGAADGQPAFADFQGVSDVWDTAAEYIALYPNVLMGVHRDHTFAIILLPEGIGRTEERVAIFYADQAAISESQAAARRENTERWKVVFREDIGVVEGMQRGRASPGFDGGRFSPVLDNGTHCLHAWVAESFMSAMSGQS